MTRLWRLSLLIVLFQPASAMATEAPLARSLDGVHCVGMSLGLLTDMTATVTISQGGTTIRSETGGLLASLDYSYGMSRDLAAQFSVGVLDADATVAATGSGSTVESAVVTTVLFGVKFRPESLTRRDNFRPYASIAVGPVMGSVSRVQAGPTTSAGAYTESAFGTRLGIGADLLLGRRFALGLGAGYRLVGSFDRRVGAEDNYSSPEVSISAGVMFGGK